MKIGNIAEFHKILHFRESALSNTQKVSNLLLSTYLTVGRWHDNHRPSRCHL